MRRALALILLCAGCRAGADDDLRPPPGFVPPPIHFARKMPLRSDAPAYGAGFFGREADDEGVTWRWMGVRGDIHLPPAPGGARLRIKGWVPRELLRAAPQLRLVLNGKELDRFTPADKEVSREYAIAAALLGPGRVTLVIETSEAAIPPGDGRTLGFAIRGMDWQPLPP